MAKRLEQTDQKRSSARGHATAMTLGIAFALVIGGCGSGGISQEHGRTEARGGHRAATANAVQEEEDFDDGKLELKPSANPVAFTNEIRDRISSDPLVAQMTAEGFTPTIEYGKYTDTVRGTPVDGVTPEEAAAMHPSPSELAELASKPLHLTYDNFPAWIVHFDNLPSNAVSAFHRGGVTLPPPSTVATPSTTQPGQSDFAGYTVLLVFTPSADRDLDMRIFPTGGVPKPTTTGKAPTR